MEFIFHLHQNSMKRLLLLSLLLITRNVFAQDTLYHPIPMMGHEKYILYEDGTFFYSSNQCGFTSISFGSYQKKVLGYTFDYDTASCPKPSIQSLKEGFQSDSITLFFNDLVNQMSLYYSGLVIIGDQTFECEEESLIIPKKLIKSNTLILKSKYSNDLTFTFDSTSSQLNIYLNLGVSECMIKGIRKLKKTKHGYMNKFITYVENNQRPWRKGKKRIVKQYYELRRNPINYVNESVKRLHQ